jgi:hypothetical protein
MSSWRRTSLASGVVAATLLTLLLLLFPVKVMYGSGSVRCGSVVRSLLGRSVSECVASGAANLRVALSALLAICIGTAAATVWEPRRPAVRRAVGIMLYTAGALVLLFVLTVYAMAP